MTRILGLFCLALVLLIPVAKTHSQSDGLYQTWSFLAGRVDIELPGDWTPMPPQASPSPLADTPGAAICLGGPGGHGFMVLHHFEDLTGLEDANAMVRSLRATCDAAGINLTHCEASRLGGRNFAIAEGQWDKRGQAVSLVVAATGLDGRPLIMVFGASGPDRKATIFTAQMAMLTTEIRETGPAEGADRSGVRTWEGYSPEGQTPTSTFPTAPTGQTTAMNRQSIPATGVSLEVPPEMVPGFLVPGYVTMDGLNLLFVEHSVIPYELAHAFLSESVLLKNGQVLTSAEDVVVDGRPGKLAHLKSETTAGPMRWWVLLTGNKKKSIKVCGRYAQGQVLAYKAPLREAVLSLQWDPAAEVYATDDLDYYFDETDHFKTVCRAHDRVVLAPRGVSLPISKTVSLVVISRGPCPGVILDHLAMAENFAEESFLIRDFKQMTGVEHDIAGARVCEIAGTATRSETTSEVAYYAGLIIWQGQYCLVQGVQDLYATVNLQQEFAKITASVRLRDAAN